MKRSQAEALPGVPRGGACTLCGGALRYSHVEYVGGGESMALHRCAGCGTVHRGAIRARDEEGAPRRGRGSGDRDRSRPLPDGGPPANPVLDPDMARLLRERLGG